MSTRVLIASLTFRRSLAISLASIALGTSECRADLTDLWFVPTESGWGLNIIQQRDISFATLFVYGPNAQPRWYVASDIRAAGTAFAGDLFETSGPHFIGAFNPNAVSRRPVGSINIAPSSANTARLTYSVDGAVITKNIERQTWRVNDLSGFYGGASVGEYVGCASNGYREENVRWFISQTGTSFRMSGVGATICDYEGIYSQSGRIGSASGTMKCTGLPTGTFTASEIELTTHGFSARAISQAGSCRWEGAIGGLRLRS